MTPDELRALPEAPDAKLLEALWHGARDDWETAHAIVMADDGADAAWVHAWLHRVEGDEANAGYWYQRAGRAVSTDSLDAEWARIAEDLLGRTA